MVGEIESFLRGFMNCETIAYMFRPNESVICDPLVAYVQTLAMGTGASEMDAVLNKYDVDKGKLDAFLAHVSFFDIPSGSLF